MVIGVCRLELDLMDNHSLKGKRSVVKRVIQRIRNRFNVAMAEVDGLDHHTVAVLGFVVVGNEKPFVNRQVDTILNAVEGLGLAPIRDSHYVIEQY